mgnify:CR=1 FL=1
MTDRELLEAAARAAGIARQLWDYEFCRERGHMVTWGMMWNPLTDDHDNAALQCALLIDAEWLSNGYEASSVLATANGLHVEEHFHDNGGDRNATRRRAIVRAAASLAPGGDGGNGE